MLLAVLAQRAWRFPLSVPFSYRGDGLVTTSLVKGVNENGWWLNNPWLAAPFGQRQYDYAHGGETLQLLILKAIGTVVDDPGTVVNLYYFGAAALVGGIAYAVLRALGRSPLVAAALAVAFALLPFRFAHHSAHLFRSNYWSVPLAALLIVWCLEPRRHLQAPGDAGERGVRWRRGRLALAAGLVVVVATTETMTNAFTMAILVASGLVLAVHHRDWRRLAIPAGAAAALFAVFITASAPTLLFHLQHGSNEAAVERRPEESAVYGLRIARFVLPPDDHPVAPLAAVGEKNTEFPDGTEGGTWMGILGLAGFLAAVFVVMTRTPRRAPGDDPADDGDPAGPHLLALVVVVATLIGTVEGFSKVAAVAGLSQVRTWNRISLLIAFFSFALVGYAVDRWWRYRQAGPTVRAVGAAVVLSLVLFDLGVVTERTQERRELGAFYSDRALVAHIEDVLPDGAAVFQLPYATYPEDPTPKAYDLLALYLHSSTLRWSHGGVEGRVEGDWRRLFDYAHLEQSLRGLLGLGFEGLTVNLDLYDPEPTALLTELDTTLGAPALSDDGTVAFYDLRPFRAALGADQGELEADAWEIFNLRPPS